MSSLFLITKQNFLLLDLAIPSRVSEEERQRIGDMNDEQIDS